MHEGHNHSIHSHDSAFETVDQAVALMNYMLDHNRHHAEELHELCHKLENMGKSEAAKALDISVDEFKKGNEYLEAALDALKNEE